MKKRESLRVKEQKTQKLKFSNRNNRESKLEAEPRKKHVRGPWSSNGQRDVRVASRSSLGLEMPAAIADGF